MTQLGVALAGITVDCRDPLVVAGFWSKLLNVEPRTDSDLPGWLRLDPTVVGGPQINFQPVPEAKSGKTRVHFDLWVDDLDVATSLVHELGGSGPSESHAYDSGTVFVMADPEGNEFCLVGSVGVA
jgi:predicted enzyme related to lactoylglutathione lyase